LNRAYAVSADIEYKKRLRQLAVENDWNCRAKSLITFLQQGLRDDV
jgi:hypothetical protein